MKMLGMVQVTLLRMQFDLNLFLTYPSSYQV
jgi:hypothetical protein